MRITVRLFSLVRERAGRERVELDLPDGATAGDALAAIGSRNGLADLVERMPIRLAVNREYADERRALADGDEVALIPPVSGGAPGTVGDAGPAPADGRQPNAVHAAVRDERLSAERVTGLVRDPRAGAIVTFEGTTREVDRLDYEAYREMAEERIATILAEAIERHGLEAAAAEHRVGAVPLGEPAVVVAVSAAHRPEAFAGAREAIDRIKAEAPIWKVEVSGSAGGAERRERVEGAPPPR